MQKRTQEQADQLAGVISAWNGKLSRMRTDAFEATVRANALNYDLDVLNAASVLLRFIDIYESGELGILYCTGAPPNGGVLHDMKMGHSGIVTSDARKRITDEIGEIRLRVFLNDVQIFLGSRAMLFQNDGRAEAVAKNAEKVSCDSNNFLEWKGEKPTLQRDDWIAFVNYKQ